MPGHDHCCTCDQCRMIGGCLGFDWQVPGSAKNLYVRMSNVPSCALGLSPFFTVGLENEVVYTLPFEGFLVEHDYKLCVFAFATEIGFASGNKLRVAFTSRDTVDDFGGPCMDVSVEFLNHIFGSFDIPCFIIASGTCTSLGFGMCGGSSPCPDGGGTEFDINRLCKCLPITIGDDYQSPSAKSTRAVISTCPIDDVPESYNCVEGTCTDPGDGTGAYSTLAECTGDGCAPPALVTFNCVGGVCTDPEDGTGTYATLLDCFLSSCAPAPPTYNCSAGICTNPNDGTGTYATIDDCLAASCGAPTCTSLDGCTSMSMVVEIGGFIDCTQVGGPFDGQYRPWSNLNGVYFLDLVAASTYVFHQDLTTGTGDYSDAGILWLQQSSSGVHSEQYVYAIDITVACTDGLMTITGLKLYLQNFSWTEPDAPNFDGTSEDESGPTSSTLTSSAGICRAGYMLSLFGYFSCGTPQTFNISGTIG